MFAIQSKIMIGFACSAYLIAMATPAPAQDQQLALAVAREINSANELVRQGKYDDAVRGYQNAGEVHGDSDSVAYNLGVAQYRKGDIDAAMELFQKAAGSRDNSIAASGRYNLGNCLYSKALQSAENDKPAAINLLQLAIEQYRSSLQANSVNPDARANIELADRLLQQLKREQEQHKQQSQQQNQPQDQQKNQSPGEQPSANSEHQPGESKSEAQRADSASQPTPEKPDQSPTGQQQPDSSQSESSQRSQNNPDQNAESQPSESGQDSSEPQAGDQAGAQRQPANPPSQNPTSASNRGEDSKNRPSVKPQSADHPPSPAGQATDSEPEPAEQSASQGKLTAAGQLDDKSVPGASSLAGDAKPVSGSMTKEEAMKMLQAVRDRDLLRRLQLEQLERSRHVPVDRDW